MQHIARLFKRVLKAAIFFTLFAFALNNQSDVTVHFFFGQTWTAPMVLVVLSAFACGLVVGVLGMVPRWWRQRGKTTDTTTNATVNAYANASAGTVSNARSTTGASGPSGTGGVNGTPGVTIMPGGAASAVSGITDATSAPRRPSVTRAPDTEFPPHGI